MKCLRRFFLLRWPSLVIGLVAAAWLYDGPVGRGASTLATFVTGFGIGVLVVAGALAEDFNRLDRHVRHVEEVNRRIVARTRRR